MDDGYDGTSSGETAESSAETGSESSTVDTGEVNTVTNAETAAAFDEQDSNLSEANPDGAEKGAETEATVETNADSKNDGITSAEVKSAFDEPSSEKTDAPKTSETKEAPTTTEVENTEPAVTEKADSSEVIHVNCTRDDLAGKEHPDTGVPYETKVVEVNGKQLEVTVPKFESDFDFKLESDQLQLDRPKHNDICNAKLKEHCEANPDWAKETFSQKQLDQINSGKKPEGYTWHHDGGEVGHMQLVDSKVHHDTRHTGGIAIWGNKSKYT